MSSLFEPSDRDALLGRLQSLRHDSPRQWGKMDAAQMLGHLAQALESGTGDRPMKQRFLGKLITPLIRSKVLGEEPFGKNSPTDPTYVVADARDFDAERGRVLTLIDRMVARGADAAGRETHPFFGKLSGEEWGRLVYKHIDHHLRQFGA